MHVRVVVILSVFSFLSAAAAPGASKRADNDVTAYLYNGTAKLPGVTLKGEQTWQSENGDKRAFAYYGYKYGQAGRFEHSVANTDFTYLDNPDRLKLGPACHQSSWDGAAHEFVKEVFNRNSSMSEDCLYLDVYLPPIEKTQDHTWPVLFWVYGGGFKVGHKDMYNGSILAASTNAVVVTVNYRIGAFGFFSTGDEAAPGNFALGDLKLALNWTLANIAKFGGDPSKITIFGQSAGGALVSALMLDHQVQRHVFAAVAMSGSIVGGWATRKDPAAGAKRLATELGCPNETSAKIVECLRKQPVDAILNVSGNVLDEKGAVFYYTPVVDGHHIPKEPVQILKERSSSTDRAGTFVNGYMADDSAVYLLTMPALLNATFDYPTVSQLVPAYVHLAGIDRNCPQNVPVKVKLILDYYNLTEWSSSQELRNGFIQAVTDIMFRMGTIAEATLYANAGQNNQMYVISYDPGFLGLGAFHFVEVVHMFRSQFFDSLLKAKMSESMTLSLHDFFRQVAHNGRVTGPSFSDNGNYHELNQQADWVNQQQDFAPLLEFWQKLTVLPCPAVVSP